MTAHGSNTVALHLAEPAILPVEVAMDAAAQTSGQTPLNELPTAVQLNLSLHPLVAADGIGEIRPRQGEGGAFAFSVPAGRYRLVAGGSSSWTVLSASFGTASLAGGEINVAGGAGGTPIRLVVANTTGQITGTIAMGDAPSVWLYLIAREPSLTPFYLERVGATGTFSHNVPPGAYLAVAVANRLQEDLHERAVVDALAARAKEVTVAAGGKATVELTVLADGGVGR